jgi:hypothetical protein
MLYWKMHFSTARASPGETWTGNALAHLPLLSSSPGEFGGVLLSGQSNMTALILEELKKYLTVEVRFGLR